MVDGGWWERRILIGAGKVKDYKELDVWQRSVNLAVSVYGILGQFPVEERFGLADQLRRSVISVASNIAEGAGRQGNREFCQFLSIAAGSIAELETQLIIAQKLGFAVDIDLLLAEVVIIRKQLNSLQKALRTEP